MGVIVNFPDMDINSLVKELFNKGTITKEEIVEFAKSCQLKMLVETFELDNEQETYRKVKNEINTLKQELEFDDNKLYIMMFNCSLN